MNADLHLHLGNLFTKAGDDAAAERTYRHALGIGAPRARSLGLLAGALTRQKRHAEALAAAREAAALAPGDSGIAGLFEQLNGAAAAPPAGPAPAGARLPEPALFRATRMRAGPSCSRR